MKTLRNNLIVKTVCKKPFAIVSLEGELLTIEDCMSLQETIHQLISKVYTRVILDLKNVTQINDRGINEIRFSTEMVSRHLGELKLIGVSESLLGVLKKQRIDVKVYKTEEEALKSFATFGLNNVRLPSRS